MSVETVAILGTGRMGGTMASTLRSAGFEVVMYNRTPAKAAAVAASEAEVAATAREAAASAPVVLSSLADDAAVLDVYSGSDGAAAGVGAGSVVLEMSTIDPRTVLELEPMVTARGAILLDAPVSGSVQLVEKGALTIMVGGPEAGLDRARPVMDALATQVFHVGSLGAGATMKLAVNAIVHAINVALSEALVLAESSGVDRSTAYEVFASSAAAAPFVLYKRPAFENPDETPVAFSVDLVAKDLDLILGLAERVGVEMTQGSANRDVARRAIEAGMGQQDMSGLASYLRERRP